MIKKLMLFLVFIIMVISLSSCQEKEHDLKLFKKEIETDEFILSVSTPTVIKSGEKLVVEGLLKYTGNKKINLFHGKPIIKFTIVNRDGEPIRDIAYTSLGYETTIENNHMFRVEDTIIIDDKGDYDLIVRTTLLAINEKPINGVGNERYLKKVEEHYKKLRKELPNELMELENQRLRMLELENSKLTIDLIDIKVR